MPVLSSRAHPRHSMGMEGAVAMGWWRGSVGRAGVQPLEEVLPVHRLVLVDGGDGALELDGLPADDGVPDLLVVPRPVHELRELHGSLALVTLGPFGFGSFLLVLFLLLLLLPLSTLLPRVLRLAALLGLGGPTTTARGGGGE